MGPTIHELGFKLVLINPRSRTPHYWVYSNDALMGQVHGYRGKKSGCLPYWWYEYAGGKIQGTTRTLHGALSVLRKLLG